MTNWTIEAEATPSGIEYDVLGRGSAARKRKQGMESINEAVAFIRRYGQPGDTVRLVEPDGYRRSLDVWARARFPEVSQ